MQYPEDENQDAAKVSEFETFYKSGAYIFLTEDEWENLYQYYLFDIYETDAKKIDFLISEALAQHKYSLFFTLRMAELKARQDGKEAALIYIELAESLSPDSLEVLETKAQIFEYFKDYKSAIINFELALAKDPLDFDLKFQLALCQSNAKKFSKALKSFYDLALIQPHNEFILDHIAVLVFDNDWFEKAVKIYKKIIDQNPYSETAWHYLGNAYSGLKLFDKAIWAQEMTLAINEKSYAGLFGLASVYQEMEDFGTAKDLYLRLLKEHNEQEDSIVEVNLGYCYEQLMENETSRVHYRKAIALDTECAAAWYGIGVSLLSENKFKESLYFFINAYKYGKNEESHFGLTLATVYINEKEYAEAHEVYNELVRTYPDQYEIWLDYSTLYSEQNKPERAIEILETAQFYLPENHQINYRLAALCLGLKQTDKARNHLNLALSNNYKDHFLLFTFDPNLKKDKIVQGIIKNFKK